MTGSVETTDDLRGLAPEVGVGGTTAESTCDSAELESLKLAILDPLSNPEWDRVASLHSDSQFFHTSAWAKVLCQTYGHKPVYLYFSRRSELIALVPLMEITSAFTGRRGVCLPFTDFCSPLVFDSRASGAVTGKILEIARRQNWKWFEIRGRECLPATAVAGSRFYGHRLRLVDSIEQLWSRLGSATRRAIRKAEKSGIAVRIDRTETGMRQFYQLHVATRRRHGVPPQPFSFFANIHEQVIKAGRGFVVLAHSESRVVAAAIFFQHCRKAVYKFAASDNVFQGLRANNLVIWGAIKHLMAEGCQVLHFGRTSLDNEGLRRFKAGWGAVEEMVEYFRFDTARETWEIARDRSSGFHTEIFRRLPLAFNRLAGAAIYRHLD
jgi:Acetyltransferase (GNAT) domain